MNFTTRVNIHDVKTINIIGLFKGLKETKLSPLKTELEEEQMAAAAVKKSLAKDDGTNSQSDFTSKACNTCSYTFESRSDQVEHYKSDWHRHNLKCNLLNRTSLSLEDFENILDDLSSISGSESSDFSDEEESYRAKSSKLFNQDDISQSRHLNEDGSVSEQLNRSPLLYFTNADNSILSVYKCALSLPKDTNKDVTTYVTEKLTNFSGKICIILLNAGHFAAAVFEQNVPVAHKTFHRYVVRAKRGTVQSQRDQKGSAPKSGGASLRRHNESELAKDIKVLLNNWKEHLDSCELIFIRSPKYNKEIFYSGQPVILKKNDDRVKGIPFSTRRPTFNEIKRVYEELFTIKIYSEYEKEKLLKEFQKSIQISPSSTDQNIHDSEKTDKQQLPKKTAKELRKQNTNSANEVTFKTDVKEEITSDNVDLEHIQEPEQHTDDIVDVKQLTVLDELYTVCKTGNVEDFQMIISNLKTEDKLLVGENFSNSIDNNGNTLLHVAAKSGKVNMVHELLTIGCDPCIKNSAQQTPYSVSCDKTTRNSFRKFMASFPDKYDYVKANIPGPLTDDMEADMKLKQNQKKKAKKQMRKEKQKVKAVELENQKLENQAKEKFANMSDREKRALAAEKRLAMQAKVKGQVSTLSAERCWKCGESLLGKVPFEYSAFKFCSIKCLKLHKGLIKE